jgi:hypothetical protein
MSQKNTIQIFLALLALIAAACSCFNIPGVATPSGAGNQPAPAATSAPIQPAPTPTSTPMPPSPTPTEAPPPNSICGWIENASTTGAMAPTMKIWDTGQVLQLYMLEMDAIDKIRNIDMPGNYRVYDPVYQDPDLLITFSSIEPASNCP